MSTRALIARKTDNGWEARYHHWDGYPAGLGKTLYDLHNGHFCGDAKKMLKVLIDEHEAWSTINDADFNIEPGFNENAVIEKPKRPQCYCHGDRSEGPFDLILNIDKDFGGAEYCYVIDSRMDTMKVLERSYENGDHATQFFGVDASAVADNVHWRLLGIVYLNLPEPAWGEM